MFEPLSIFANIEQLLRKRNICGTFDKPFDMRLQVSVFDNLVFVEWSFPGTLIVRRHSRKGRLCWRAPHKLGKSKRAKKQRVQAAAQLAPKLAPAATLQAPEIVFSPALAGKEQPGAPAWLQRCRPLAAENDL